MFFNKEPERLLVIVLLHGGAGARELRLRSIPWEPITQLRRAAAAFRHIAKQGEAGADAAIVWADGDHGKLLYP